MQSALEREVWSRAKHSCDYCLLPAAALQTPFHLDHITAKKHDGLTETTNLALACLHCNGFKGANIAGIDPADGQLVRLFHPRCDRWSDHFQLLATGKINPKTAPARVTLRVLRINARDMILMRALLIREGTMTPTNS